ncbi:hypothetical protein DE146DRAFT_784576 [Phaeosphaeria sp. MPI-PUGE-AT-0046c]|nr:hypothetical protein DE146DRAFT_784576 [Phaeosphaeria sp. MPI-PUGE-AT-0046c]
MLISNQYSKPQRAGHQSETTNDLDTSSKPAVAVGPGLKQIQYRSYQQSITIYHFRADFISVHDFRNLLHRDEHGYIDTLIGRDTLLPIEVIPEGDIIPAGRIEVAHLPYVLRSGHKADGSALGFRSGDGIIEWMCFDRCIKALILDAWTCAEETRAIRILKDVERNDPSRLFDSVAELEKGIAKRAVRGANEEHKQFHVSLWDAQLRNVRVRLLWKGFGTELRRSYGERWEREDKAREREEERKMLQQQYEDGFEAEVHQERINGVWGELGKEQCDEVEGVVRHEGFDDGDVQDRMDTS